MHVQVMFAIVFYLHVFVCMWVLSDSLTAASKINRNHSDPVVKWCTEIAGENCRKFTFVLQVALGTFDLSGFKLGLVLSINS
jgi:hypothetical protein